jgi:hypothetical protein
MEKEPVLENTKITSHTAANMLGITFGPVQCIRNNNLNVCHNITKSVPHLRTEEQNDWLKRK